MSRDEGKAQQNLANDKNIVFVTDKLHLVNEIIPNSTGNLY